MKAIIITLFVCFLGTAGNAQTTSTGTVNIIFRAVTKATANYEVRIDDKRYFSNTNTNNATIYKIMVNNLLAGTRALKVYKLKNNNPAANNNSQNTLMYSNSFKLRPGYDMNITIRPNGSVQFNEQASAATPIIINGPLTTTAFNSLKQSIQNQWSQSMKAEKIRDAFVNTDNHFTSEQVSQLLVLISSESDRLDLAKLAYARVTDASNFSALSDVFNSTAKRNEFAEFIEANAGSSVNTGTKSLITDANFSTLVSGIKSKWSQSLKGDAIRDALVNSNNYYNTTQIRQLMALITSESDKLDLIKLSYELVSDPNNFGSLYDVFTSSANRTAFNDYVKLKGGFIANTGVKEQMSDYSYNQLIQSIGGKWSQALKADAVKDAFMNTNNYFSTAQIKQLLVMINSETDRFELAKLSFRSVMDPAYFSQLADVFSSASYRDEFNTYVQTQTGVTAADPIVKSPMADSEFSILTLTVRAKFLQLLKYSNEIEIFNNPNYFFSTNQVKQLISLINSEPSRLELAKLSYKTVTDPMNFTSLDDLFTSQASRDELANYVKNLQR